MPQPVPRPSSLVGETTQGRSQAFRRTTALWAGLVAATHVLRRWDPDCKDVGARKSPGIGSFAAAAPIANPVFAGPNGPGGRSAETGL